MPLFVLFAIISAILNAFLGVFQKLISKYSVQNFFAYSFYSFLIPFFFAPFLFIIFGYASPWPAIRFLIPQIVFFFGASTLLNYVLFQNDASNINPLFPLKLIFMPFIAYILLGEHFSPILYFFIAVIVLGGILVAFDETFRIKTFFKKGTVLLLLALFLFAIADVFVNKTSQIISSYQALAWQTILLAPLSFIFLLLKGKKTITFDRKSLFFMAGVSLLLLVFFSFLYRAFTENVTLTNSLAMLNGPLTLIIIVIIGKLKPDLLERHSQKVYLVRIFGSLLMYGAAVGIILNF